MFLFESLALPAWPGEVLSVRELILFVPFPLTAGVQAHPGGLAGAGCCGAPVQVLAGLWPGPTRMSLCAGPPYDATGHVGESGDLRSLGVLGAGLPPQGGCRSARRGPRDRGRG